MGNRPIQFLCLILCFLSVRCRIHRLEIEEDYRRFIKLTSFGFYKDGYLSIEMENFHYKSASNESSPLFGFTLRKVLDDNIDSFSHIQEIDQCALSSESMIKNSMNMISFKMDLEKQQ